MNKLAILLCVVLFCSCTINAQLGFLNGLTSTNAFLLGALGTPLLGGILSNSGLGGGPGMGGGNFILPPPPPFNLQPPVYAAHGPTIVHRRRYIRY